ncbi:MAG: IS3 family transposase [Nanoarchaeota archaeon]|nr:IS3 family transposase [Nanoarchaeota archaeon]
MSIKPKYRYSQAFKQQVIKEIETGMISIAEASRIYDISVGGIYKWIRSFGKDHLIGEVVWVQKRDEVDKIKKLEADKRQLEAALAEANLDNFCLESLISVVEEKYGISVKKLWFKGIETGLRQMNSHDQRFSIAQLCDWFGYSRQGYYQHKRLVEKQQEEETMILAIVRQFRRQQPRVGGRKLYCMLQECGFYIGRDRLFEVLRDHHMLVRRRKRYTRTTDSRHPFRCYPNLIKDIQIDRPGQVYVSDITYIHTLEGFLYLALVTDYYSRKIFGYDLSSSLSIDGSIRALKMALCQAKDPSNLIHHSDRGVQYCCKVYTDLLKKHGVKISMTEQDHVYENALAERVNGILKDEFCLGDTLQSKDIAGQLVKESVRIYNQYRLHMALNYRTPESVYVSG